ncbi:MAG: immunoglobulin domain-containing protein, partial [Phycisphaerales bacterium]
AASVRYDAAGPADANGNLVPDECETQCPSVTQQPEAEVLPCIGGALSLSVAASGSPAPTYQWTRNGANIDGATSATLAVSPVGVADTGEYRCVVTNACGSATSEPSQVTVCAADFNCTGLPATVQDIFDFLNGYFSGDPRADVNGSGGVSVQDIFDFLSAYFSGC